MVERLDVIVDQRPLIGGEFGLDLGFDQQIVDNHLAPLRASIVALIAFRNGIRGCA